MGVPIILTKSEGAISKQLDKRVMEWQIPYFKNCAHEWCRFRSSIRQLFGRHWKRVFSFPSPFRVQDKCRIESETIRFSIFSDWTHSDLKHSFFWSHMIMKKTHWLLPSLVCQDSRRIKSQEIFSINSNDRTCITSCLPHVQDRLAACYKTDGLPCANNGRVCAYSKNRMKYNETPDKKTPW